MSLCNEPDVVFFLSLFLSVLRTHKYQNMYHQHTAKTLDDAVGHERRYKILCAHAVPEPCDPQKATQIILEAINLESDQYRMGHTKVSDTYCDPRRAAAPRRSNH